MMSYSSMMSPTSSSMRSSNGPNAGGDAVFTGRQHVFIDHDRNVIGAAAHLVQHPRYPHSVRQRKRGPR
jgi:hypothetical protein